MPFRDHHLSYFKTLASIKTPRTIRVVAVMLIMAIILTILFFIFAPWVQTAGGMGKVTSLNPNDRQQEIHAFVSGRIEQWFVNEGSSVKRDDPIVRLADRDPLLIERLQSERSQVMLQLEAARNGLATAKIDLERTQELYEKGLAARRDFELAQIKVEDYRGKVGQMAAKLEQVEVNLSRQSAQTVFAPRDGVIMTLNAGDVSTYVKEGQILATFVPENPQRVIEIYIDGRDVALVRKGASARVQFEGWPAVQFTGWPSVAIGTFGGIVTAIDPSAQPNGQFRVLISEDPDAENAWPDERYVRIGGSVKAWILLETVPVGYEVWRRLNSFPPQLPAEKNQKVEKS